MRSFRRFPSTCLTLGFALPNVAYALGQDAPRAQAASGPARAAPLAGEFAPPVKLKTLDGRSELHLASLRGRRPVVLFFGSYT